MDNERNIRYNSQKDTLIIAEYGRHVQNLIDYAKTIEDKEKRQSFTEGVIFLMYQMNPTTKNISEVEEKLWKHAFRISGYELDVDPPEGITITKGETRIVPETIPYPHKVRKHRHYGGYIQDMIQKAKEMEDPEKQKEFVSLIGSYLKLAYRTWNKDHYANDEMIKADLMELFDGKLDFISDISLDLLAAGTGPANQSPKVNLRGKKGNQRKRSKSNNGTNHRNRNKRRR